ncbi:hypothetical protein SFOMI_4749 [Sphingobium fuliginis]|jgi:hypothetical protein|uniref:Uncharacterized protein n=1 Tax=Sphingobium fuliginis (strain ATCC 27551) TaxID=336203 RepID=A0A292ZMQ9_SPHSA|nr:hypothetical protein SFOMI_4749 [Sphingobium fuliginis]
MPQDKEALTPAGYVHRIGRDGEGLMGRRSTFPTLLTKAMSYMI